MEAYYLSRNLLLMILSRVCRLLLRPVSLRMAHWALSRTEGASNLHTDLGCPRHLIDASTLLFKCL